MPFQAHLHPRIFCVGRNYVDHIEELENEVPSEPVIFIKPYSCLEQRSTTLPFPTHGADLQHEIEVVVKIGKAGRPQHKEQARNFISGITLGLDLTLRDLQLQLKQQGLPWEKAKAFEHSAPIAIIRQMTKEINVAAIEFSCLVNNAIKQQSNTSKMLVPICDLIYYISSIWAFVPGDLIFTGTPKGVSSIKKGDVITIKSETLNINHQYRII